MRALKAGFLCAQDPNSPFAFSGSLQMMKKALEAQGIQWSLLGHKAVSRGRLARQMDRIRLRLDPNAHPKPWHPSKHLALIHRDLERMSPDVVFAPVASHLLQDWPFDTPVVYYSDATPKLMRGYYTPFLPPGTENQAVYDAGPDYETKALRHVSAAVYSSHWAAESAIQDYGADPEKVHVVPFGANTSGGISVEALEQRQVAGPLRLLFISKDWERKGGSLAVTTLEQLRRRGIDAELFVVGTRPPIDLPPHVHYEGFLSRAEPDQAQRMQELLHTCQLFLLPTRADCTPIVFNEAHAYGMPVVSTLTGGVPSVVRDGVTARLLPLEAGPEQWADAVAELWADPEKIKAMSIAARRRFENHLTWEAWAGHIVDIFHDLAGSKKQVDPTRELVGVS